MLAVRSCFDHKPVSSATDSLETETRILLRCGQMLVMHLDNDWDETESGDMLPVWSRIV